MSEFLIRPIEKDDLHDEYYELLGQLTLVDSSSMSLEKSMQILEKQSEDHKIYVIECKETGAIVGSGTLFVESKFIRNYGKVGHIEDIVICHKQRGSGLGKLLLSFLTKESKKQGCYKCILDCSEENVKFYEKCSYVKKGIQMGIYF